MSRYEHLKFFDKEGNSIQTQYDPVKGYHYGSIIFPEVSVNLFETNTIYILEDLLDNSLNDIIGHPRIDLNNSSNEVFIKLQDKDQGFKIFEVSNFQNPESEITFLEEKSSNFLYDINDSYDTNTGKIITQSNVSSAFRIDICINSDIERICDTNLIIEDENGIIAIFNLYGETVEEDERLRDLLLNINELFAEDIEYIFRESNINEDLPNWKLLNKKRKEFLVEVGNIKPYYSTYKGLLGTLFLFGYSDIKVKEYWYNRNSSKFFLEDINNVELALNDDPNLEKTSYFGLFYDILIPDGSYNELGLPNLKKNFQYSVEEVSIKLNGLKKYIKDKGIGGVSQILDIVGEFQLFSKINILNWTDRSKTFKNDIYKNIKFECNKKIGYIEDIRPILNQYLSCPISPSGFTPNVQLTDAIQCYIGYFANYNQQSPEFLDDSLIPVGCPITLTDKTFSLTIKEIQTLWSEFASQNLNYTFNNIKFGLIYDTEWTIEWVKPLNDNRQPFKFSVRKKVELNQNLDTILPYEGFYNVSLTLYGYNGLTQRLTKRNFIEVKTKTANFLSFFRIIDPDLQKWKGNKLKWNQLKNEWNKPIFDNGKYLMSLNKIQFSTFDVSKYLALNSFNNKNVGTNIPSFKHLKGVSWSDLRYSTWNYLKYDPQRRARAIITKISANGQIQINDNIFVIPNDYAINDFERLKNTLESLSPIQYPEFSKNEYVYRKINTEEFIEIISKNLGSGSVQYFGSSGGVVVKSFFYDNPTWNDLKGETWKKLKITWNNSENLTKSNYLENAFGLDNIRIYDEIFHCPKAIPIFFSVDNSEMPGKTDVIWKLTKNNNDVISIRNKTFVYKFFEEGDYSLEVTIFDTNGNKNSIKKENIIKVISGKTFKNLYKKGELI